MIAQSKITAQGQISVPASIRRKLGLGPGSVIEWDERDGEVVVRRAGKVSSEEIHRALFSRPPERRTLSQLKRGLRQHAVERHARR